MGYAVLAGILLGFLGPTDSGLREEARVRLVLLPTSVTTPKGKPVRDLGVEDFVLTDAGEPREIDFVSTEEDLPASIAFVLDVSGSMGFRGDLEQAKQAIRRLVDEAAPADRLGLICFADSQVTWVTRFTHDKETFLRRLGVQEGLGPTALYDALAASPGLVDEEVRGRRAIVLLTDGVDNASDLTTLEAIWIARRVKVPIYVLDFLPYDPARVPARARRALRILGRFAEETGGDLYPVHTPRQLSRAVDSILRNLRFQYVVGFRAEGDGDGSFRPVRLEPRKSGLRVRTRSGYYDGP